MTRQPQTRLELLRSIEQRVAETKAAGLDFVILGTWEASWLLIPTLISLEAEVDGTGQIMHLDMGAEVTKRNKPVRIATPEQFVKSLDCNAETEEFAVGD